MRADGAVLWLSVACWWCVRGCGGGAVRDGEVAAFVPGTRTVYAAESGLVMTGGDGAAEVGVRMRSRLTVAVVWPTAASRQPHDDFLLYFEVRDIELLGRGKKAGAKWESRESEWSTPRASDGYARWTSGLVQPYLADGLPPHLRDYQRALLSLLQFQILDGERNETDASGDCRVTYETVSPTEIRKIKRRCDEESGEDGVLSRRVSRVSLRPSLAGVARARADETHEAAWRAAGVRGVKARAWLSVAADATPEPYAASDVTSMQHALDAMPEGYRKTTLRLTTDTQEEEEDLEAILEEGGLGSGEAEGDGGGEGGEGAGEGGTGEAALFALRASTQLCRRNATAILQLLQQHRSRNKLTALLRLVGSCGTAEAHGAAEALLQMRAADAPAQMAEAYLAAAALAHRTGAIAEALGGLAKGAKDAHVRRAAMLAAARHGALACSLEERRDDARARDCAVAVGVARRTAAAEQLLRLAEEASSDVAIEALVALERLPATALPAKRARRLFAVAADAARPLEVRSAALLLGARRTRHMPPLLHEAALALAADREHSAHAHELARLLRQRLQSLAARDSAAHAPLAAAAATHVLRLLDSDPRLRDWRTHFDEGTSTVMRRDTGWRAGEWRAQLDSVQVTSEGLLRRGIVTLLLSRPAEVDDDEVQRKWFDGEEARREDDAATTTAVAIAVWARGMAAMAGAGAGAGDDEEFAAGLSVDVAGARIADVTLFDGQAELLGHVWAGTGSSATPVVRAFVPLRASTRRVPLQIGLSATMRLAAGAGVAVDARGEASLWSRTARAALALRAGLAASARARVAAPSLSLSAASRSTASPRLRVDADLDFYSRMQLCARARLPPYRVATTTQLESSVGARRWSVRRRETSTATREGRSLSLGRRNDRACADLVAAEQHDHDDDL